MQENLHNLSMDVFSERSTLLIECNQTRITLYLIGGNYIFFASIFDTQAWTRKPSVFRSGL